MNLPQGRYQSHKSSGDKQILSSSSWADVDPLLEGALLHPLFRLQNHDEVGPYRFPRRLGGGVRPRLYWKGATAKFQFVHLEVNRYFLGVSNNTWFNQGSVAGRASAGKALGGRLSGDWLASLGMCVGRMYSVGLAGKRRCAECVKTPSRERSRQLHGSHRFHTPHLHIGPLNKRNQSQNGLRTNIWNYCRLQSITHGRSKPISYRRLSYWMA